MFEKILIIAVILGSGLIAGVFYGFSTFIMKALGRIPANEGIAAMQSINITVINPLFLGVFMGTGILCGVLIVMSLLNWNGPSSIIPIAGSVLYIVGCLAVTTTLNVPLNNELAAVNATDPKSAEIWTRYLSDWTFWNSVRTAASLATTAVLAVWLAWVK
ncbi:MAG TPA: anthrone oxygenase family protein [Pyrinomonadaceae bacterium]|nr:anthrone oxygenase family protein [Pyrinomonadaceae bacterium]